MPVGGCWPAGERCDNTFAGLEVRVRFCKLVTLLLDVFMVFPRENVDGFTLDFLMNNEFL